jgi:hypothetical protein
MQTHLTATCNSSLSRERAGDIYIYIYIYIYIHTHTHIVCMHSCDFLVYVHFLKIYLCGVMLLYKHS